MNFLNMATSVAQADRIALRIAVSAPGHGETPVELEAPADATLGAAAEALAHSLGVDADEVVLERTGRRLPRDAR
jgi:hypothetical protein